MSTTIDQLNEAVMGRELSEMPTVTPMANGAPSVEAKTRLKRRTELLLSLALILGLAIAEGVVVVTFLNRLSPVAHGNVEELGSVQWLEFHHWF